MRTYKNKALFALIMTLFVSISASAIQNPTKKTLVAKETEKKAITLDEKGHIIVNVLALNNEITISLIEQKIDTEQAYLKENTKIAIKPTFPYDCNTFASLWLLENLNLQKAQKAQEPKETTK